MTAKRILDELKPPWTHVKTRGLSLLWALLATALPFGLKADSEWIDKSPHKVGFITANDVKLHYLDWGGAGETLLFLHGMGDTAHIYDELAPRFTNQFRALGLTRRGHGESEIPETGYDTATLVEDIRQFLDALKIQRVVLAGHSFAGDELTRFAVVHPDRVIKLIYFDAAYDHSRVPESLRFKRLHGWVPEIFPTKEEGESPDGRRRWTSRLFGEQRGRTIYSMMEGTYSETHEYSKIKAPALAFFAIGYEKDLDRAEALPEPQRKNEQEFLKAQRKYHEQEMEHFRKEIPNSRVVVLTNANHACFIDREDEVVREMRAFLAPSGVPAPGNRANDGWETADLASVHLKAELIKDLLESIRNNTYKNIHSVLLVKNGKLVVEEYFPGQQEDGKQQAFTRDTLHEIHSTTKSINSILIGIAIDQKLIRGVDEKVSTFFPEYADIFADGKRDAICLKHLLSMTAGLSWDEWTHPYSDARNDHVAMNRSHDPVRYALERPVVAAPGTKFAYSSGVSIILGEIIHKVSGLRADKFAERQLFAPLGISEYSWLKYPNGVVQTGGGLLLRPRDMAKIGYLVLQGGRWRGKQIVSEAWLEESLKQHAPDRAYGYQWWLGQLQARDEKIAVAGAQGRGGQFILIMPSVQMVAVFTSWNDGNGLGEQPFDMLQKFILPAVRP